MDEDIIIILTCLAVRAAMDDAIRRQTIGNKILKKKFVKRKRGSLSMRFNRELHLLTVSLRVPLQGFLLLSSNVAIRIFIDFTKN